jgi:sugar phosphate isomerase/epimerase
MLKLSTKFAPHESSLAMARDAGYRYAEIWTDAAVLADWRAVAERCARYPLEYVVHFPNREPRDEQSLAHAVSLCRGLNCPAMVIHQPLFDRLSGRLLAMDAALPLAVENHVLSPPEFEAWAGENPGLTLDVEHLWQFTLRDCPLAELLAAVASFLERYGHKLLHVHLPGYEPGQANHRPMHASPEMVLGVFSLLAEHDYQGFIVSELAGEHQTPEVLAADMALFAGWSGKEHDERPSGL